VDSRVRRTFSVSEEEERRRLRVPNDKLWPGEPVSIIIIILTITDKKDLQQS